jgi:hypothetical protein
MPTDYTSGLQLRAAMDVTFRQRHWKRLGVEHMVCLARDSHRLLVVALKARKPYHLCVVLLPLAVL